MRAPADLVLISGADAAAGGADLAGTGRILANDVELAMERQDESGIVGDPQIVAGDRDTLAADGSRSRSISAQGSTTTPLPMMASLPGRTMPEGSSDSL